MNKLSHEKINEIKNSVDIVDIISSYVSLKPEGKNFFGVCPFHDDTNPSMSVNPEKQIYKCFSCGASGTVFNFIMDFENMSFAEAVKTVADLGGVKIEGYYAPKTQNHGSLYDIYSLSLKYYMNNINSAGGKEAKKYLKKRGIDEKIIKEFQIGLALKNKNTLSNILVNKFKPDDVLKSGLTGNGNFGYYDLFYDRIMFPLYNLNGQVVAYSGRIYNKEDNAKYFNTRETEIFKKGELLYNYHRAKNIARQKNQIIVMEGFMDVIRAHSVGIKNVIASMGTAVTTKQANLIKKMAKEVILCFDGDEAGAKATEACIKELTNIGVIPKIIRLENNMDPDEFILKNGVEAFQRRINNPINVIDFELDYLKQGKNLKNPEEEAKYVSEVINEINKIDDDILREVTIKKIVDETKLSEELIRSHIKEKSQKKKTNNIQIHTKYTKYEKAEKNLIYYMLKSSEVIKMYDKKVNFMPDREYRLLAREICEFYKEYGEINEGNFIDYIEGDAEFKETLKKVNQNMMTEEYSIEEINDYIKVIKEFNIKTAIKRMQDKIKKLSDPIEKAKVAQKIIDLKKGV